MAKSNARRRTRTAAPPDLDATALVSLTVRVHAEARRSLRVRSGEQGRTIEEVVRGILYRDLGLDHLPAAVRPIPKDDRLPAARPAN